VLWNTLCSPASAIIYVSFTTFSLTGPNVLLWNMFSDTLIYIPEWDEVNIVAK
jgi:hypothetical protein